MRQIDVIRVYQTKRCLIIDDMNEVRGSLKRMLTTLGVKASDTAATSSHALEACENRPYDIVICDYNLGAGKDGQQVLEELRFRKLLKNTSIFLMITAETSRNMVLGALEYLPDDYLTKPITPQLLNQRLTRVVLRQEDLMAIKQAIDDLDYPKAIQECQKKLNEGGKYTTNYLRIQAELLYRLGEYTQAESIYQQALGSNHPVWAQLGLGKTYLAQQRFGPAEQQLQAVIDTDSRYVEAHDLLADVYAAQGDFESSQTALENAAEVSPKSVLRQRRLADMANKNRDTERSIKARKDALKVGENSCHHTAQDYFDVISELVEDKTANTDEKRGKRAKEAEEFIKRAQRKHESDSSFKAQTAAAESRIANLRQQTEKAAGLLQKAEQLLSEEGIDGYAKLRVAEALQEQGHSKKASKLIAEAAKENPDNNDISRRADNLSDEPVSKEGRRMAAELTKKGIRLYDEKQFEEALQVFDKAIGLFPNHVGLKLNLVQVALAKMKSSGTEAALLKRCQKNLSQLHELAEDDKQYARYQHLLGQVNSLFG